MSKRLTKKTGKSAATGGENVEISARKALKICKMPPTVYNKMLQIATNFEYTIEYTIKHIKGTYYNKNHQIISSKEQISSTNKPLAN